MSRYQITVQAWNQGQYSGGSYTGSSAYIASNPIEVLTVAHSVKLNTNPVTLDYWTKDSNNQWYIYDTQPYRQGGLNITLFDENMNSLHTYSTESDIVVNLDSYPATKYIIVTASDDYRTVNRNIRPVPPTPEDTNSTWYTLHDLIIYDYECYDWCMGEDGWPTNDYLPEELAEFTTPIPKSQWTIVPGINQGFPSTGFYVDETELETLPMPKMFWRITRGYNNDFPFNELMIDVPYINPWPVTGQGEASVIDDVDSIEYKRYSTSGYTNPDLIRFQDKEFEEGDIQKIGIFGLNSYRYIEHQTYTEGSTTEEVP